MKTSDFVTTASERNAAKADIAHTEMIDAVNSGIVGKADKSGRALKDDLYERTSSRNGGIHTQRSGSSREGGVYSGHGGTNPTDLGEKSAESTLTSGQKGIHLRGALAASSASSILKDSELEGMDDVYNEGRATSHAIDAIKKRSSSGSVNGTKKHVINGNNGANKNLGQLAQKKYQATKNTAEVQKAAQAQKNQMVSREVAKAKAAKSAATTGAGAKSASGGAAAAKGGAGAALAPVAGFVLLFLFIAFLLMAISTLTAIVGDEENNVGQLEGSERVVAEYLLGKGMDAMHVAAIMGNIEAESAFDSGGIEAGNGIGHGLCQWSFGRWDQLRAYATSKGKSWTDIYLQLDFLWAEMTGEGDAAAYTNVQYNHAGFLATGSLEDAVYYWGRYFERPNEVYAHWDRRISSAQRYYALITGADSSERISEAKKHLGKPYVWGATGPSGFDCSGFVYYVLNQTGYSTSRLTADGYYNMCTIIPELEAKPGDLIFFRGTYGAPNFVSHIGFYMGDGQMIHAGDPVNITSYKTSYWQSHSPEFGRLP